MIAIISAVFGAMLGAWKARRRHGNGKDIAQYAAIHALIFAVLGMFVTIVLLRAA